MFYFDKKLRYPVKVETPDPIFARMLQQAIGGIEGEIRVCSTSFRLGLTRAFDQVPRHALAYGLVMRKAGSLSCRR